MSTMEDRMSRVERILAEIADTTREMQVVNREMQVVNREMQERNREMQERNRKMRAANREVQEGSREFIREVQEGNREMRAANRELQEGSREFNREMQERNREMQERNRETQERNREFIREMHEGNREVRAANREFIREMQADTRAFREERRAAQRKWGELANKMGTLVEDIVAPGLATVFRQVLGLDRIDAYGQRVRRTHRADPGRQREFDYVASAGDLLLVNETKSTVRPEDIPAFIIVLQEARDYLPEADGRAIIGALAGFSVDPSLVAFGERQGLFMFGLGTGLLRVLNTPGLQPRRF